MPFPQTTKVSRQDLQVFPSERLTQNDDGGGMPIGTPLTGADNELVEPISEIAWLNGAFYALLVYMGVRRADAEPLSGPYAAITVPPKNDKLSYLLFPATKFGEYRQEILQRIESYVVGSIESKMTLLGRQSKYSKIIQAYQRVGEPLPLVGDVYELKQDKAGYNKASQFVKVINVEAEDRTFTRNKIDFKRTVVKLELTTKLEEDFEGVEYPSTGYANAACQIKETNVADAATYYGVKPLVQAIAQNSPSIKVSGIFEKIIPTNEVSFQLKDQQIASSRTLFDAAKSGTAGLVSITLNDSSDNIDSLYLPNSCVPSSLVITTNTGDITDSGGELLKGSEVVGSINHVDKLLTITASNLYLKTLTFRPAAGIQKVSDTSKIDVTINNRSTEYAITVNPPPPAGTVSVSYRAQGKWYTLRDAGNGSLRGVSEQHGSGSASNTTGTINVSCGALPDVGSSIIFSWGSKSQYFNRAGQATSAKMVMQLKDNAAPESIVLNWNDGTEKTATCDAAGNITGSWTGVFDKKTNQVRINTGSGFNHPAGALTVTASYNTGAKQALRKENPLRDASGNITISLGDNQIKPNTLRMKWGLLIDNYDSPMSTTQRSSFSADAPTKDAFDNGAGKLVDDDGVEYGTIDYVARTLTFNPNTTVSIAKRKFLKVPIGTARVDNVSGNTRTIYRELFNGYEYIQVTATMPATNGWVELSFYDTTSGSAVTESLTSEKVEIDLLKNYAEVIAPNSLYFTWGGKTYFERNGNLYTDLNVKTGSATYAGTIDNESNKATLNVWKWTNGSAPDVKSLATTINGNPVDAATFRTPKSPIQQGMIITAETLDGQLLTAVADAAGVFSSADMSGSVDVQFGVVSVRFGQLVDATGNENESWYNADAVDTNGKIFKPRHVFASSIRYTAFASSFLPINSDIVKIDTVRLPQDGRVSIFRAGDSILISNSKTDELGSAFQSGQTVSLSRNDVDRICLKDADNKPVIASAWKYDLSAGTITFDTPLDLSNYKMPLFAEHTRQERNRVLSADIDGTLTLLEPTGRAYDIADTYVSSLLIGENLQVRHSIPFTQRNWDGVWRDEPVGDQLLNKLNLTDHPMVLTDNGAITQRWLIKFKSSTQFDLYGERLGFVGTFETIADLAPKNPWTQVPYFTIPKEAFGNDAPWASQDIAAFKTWGTLMPVWILCAAQPSKDVPSGKDGFKYGFFGNTTEI